MGKRIKKVVITGVTRDGAEEAFSRYAKADSEITKLTAEIELECTKIRDKYSERLAALTVSRDLAFDTLNSYATENKAELFSKKKSLDMAHGTIGFRTGTPKLKTLRGFTWAKALPLVKEYLPGYIRTNEEVAKDKMLADRDSKLGVNQEPMSGLMAKCGIEVVQDESFFVEAKKEEL